MFTIGLKEPNQGIRKDIIGRGRKLEKKTVNPRNVQKYKPITFQFILQRFFFGGGNRRESFGE